MTLFIQRLFTKRYFQMTSPNQTKIKKELTQLASYQGFFLGLTRMTLNLEDVQFLFDLLKENPNVKTLSLLNVRFDKGAMKHFATQLGENASFTALNLTGAKIEEAEAKLLAQALKKNTQLTALSLSQNELGEKEAHYIAEWLKDNHSLTSLSLSSNRIGHEGAKHIAAALQGHPSLLSLELDSNNIEDTGAQYVADALVQNKSINTLNLESNYIRMNGASAIANALKQNNHLCKLNLNSNCLKEEGALVILEALNTHNKIDALNINSNQITIQDSSRFIAALKANTSLKSLSLASNELRDKGAEAIATVLKAKLPLRSLDITDNSMTDEGITTIAQALKFNKSLNECFLFANNNFTEQSIESVEQALSVNKLLMWLDHLFFMARKPHALKDKIDSHLQRNKNIAQTLLTKLAEHPLSHSDYIAIAEHKDTLLGWLNTDSWKSHPDYKELCHRIKNIEEEFSRDFLKKAGITKDTEITVLSKENTSVTLPQEVLHHIGTYLTPQDIERSPWKSQQNSEVTSLQSSVNVTDTTISNQDNSAAISNLPPSEAQGQAAPSKTATKSWLGQIKDSFVSWVKSIANSVTNLFASKTTNNTSAKEASSLNKDSNQCNHPAKEAKTPHSSFIAGKVEEQHHSPTKSWTDYITGLLSSKTNQNNLAHNPTSSSKGRF